MKSLITTAAALTAAMTLGAGTANAATITQTVGNLDWNSAIWGAGPEVPTSGNDYVTATVGNGIVRFSADLNDGTNGTAGGSTFGGDNLQVITGTRGLLKNINSTSTINGNLTISGGQVDHGPNNPTPGSSYDATLSVNNLIISGTGSLGIGENTGNFDINGTLTGSGDLEIYSASIRSGTISISNISAFTGAITLDSTAGELWTLDFGLSDYTFSNSFTFNDTKSALSVESAQTFTFNEGDLVDAVNGIVAAGTYSASDLGVNYTGDGTIVVIPEPSSLALLGLGGLLIARRRRG